MTTTDNVEWREAGGGGGDGAGRPAGFTMSSSRRNSSRRSRF
jgi:hypothetical protein